MTKAITLAGLLFICCIGAAQAWVPGPTLPTGPFPEPGTFCAPFQPCSPELVTRGDG